MRTATWPSFSLTSDGTSPLPAIGSFTSFRILSLTISHHRVIAHFYIRLDGITGLIYMSQHMDILTRVLVVSVPFIILDDKCSGNVIHYRMRPVFHLYGAITFLSDVVFVTNSTHEVGEPLPHTVSVELSQQ